MPRKVLFFGLNPRMFESITSIRSCPKRQNILRFEVLELANRKFQLFLGFRPIIEQVMLVRMFCFPFPLLVDHRRGERVCYSFKKSLAIWALGLGPKARFSFHALYLEHV